MRVHLFDDELALGHHGAFLGGLGSVLLADGHDVEIHSPELPSRLDSVRLRWHQIAPARRGDRMLSVGSLRAAGRKCGPDDVFLDLNLDKRIPFVSHLTRSARTSVHVLHRPFRHAGPATTVVGRLGRLHVRRELRQLSRRGSWIVVHSASGLRAVDELGADRAVSLGYPVAHDDDCALQDEREPEPGRLLFVGKARSEKGLPVLLDALEALGDGFELEVVGPQPAGLVAHLAGMYPRLRVRWIDHNLTDEDLAAAFRRASLVILPYTLRDAYAGGASAVALEAMLHGIPMVLTEVVAIDLPLDYGGAVVAETGAWRICDGPSPGRRPTPSLCAGTLGSTGGPTSCATTPTKATYERS